MDVCVCVHVHVCEQFTNGSTSDQCVLHLPHLILPHDDSVVSLTQGLQALLHTGLSHLHGLPWRERSLHHYDIIMITSCRHNNLGTDYIIMMSYPSRSDRAGPAAAEGRCHRGWSAGKQRKHTQKTT